MTRTCTLCKTEKPLDDFYPHKRGKFGKQSRCKPCSIAGASQWNRDNRSRHNESTRTYMLRARYGVDQATYQLMLVEQEGVCALCKLPPHPVKGLHIDHDHSCCAGVKTCGRCVRRLLCYKCNGGLGFFNDDIDLLQKAIEYIRAHQPVKETR